ncbi:DNA-binding SARP family transcriptional activator [Hamadaea flava]|uniref:BTAD domain-containing putative transcriptional regulator n=1 Tax=Hamadaea flava TaxID=1742688 RepID=A0ABV8LLL7_9ACTN|nr:BTAD domain-containing putative transcriptional regulator [Hamadaea flava]MCP2323620.1 DNA-binding SARP family transcriptional activator [Hamadaea flava]
MAANTSPWTRLARGVRAVVNTICSLTVMAGFAWFLVRLSGWPLPDHWPTRAEWIALLDDPLQGSFLRDLGACTGWLLLLLIVTALAVEIIARLAHRRWPRLRLPAPLRALAAGIVGASIIGLITGPAHAKTTSGPAQKPPAATAVVATPATMHPSIVKTTNTTGKVTFVVKGQRYHVTVRRGDTMSTIARQWLGNADRWPEICRLNKHRHFAAGGTLRDCDLIYPRWDLKLPADAVPPTGAIPAHKPTPNPPTTTPPATDPELPPRQPPVTPTIPTPSPSITTPATVDPDGVVNLETTAPSNQAPTPDRSASSKATAARSAHTAADSWLTYTLAAALLAAATLVIRRRRLARQSSRDRATRTGQPRPLPYIATLARHLLRLPDSSTRAAHRNQPDDETIALPAELGPPDTRTSEPAAVGAVGMVGPEAVAATRAAVIAALSPDGDNPPGHVITTTETMQALLDDRAVDTTGWPHLHICDSVDDALDEMHAQLLATRRTLDDPVSTHPTVHRTLLVLVPPLDHHQTDRMQSLLEAASTSAAVRIVGDWPTSQWIAVDGTTDGNGPGQAQLTAADTVDALHLIREATAGPATAPPPDLSAGVTRGAGDGEPIKLPRENGYTAAAVGAVPGPDGDDKATLQVLGQIAFGPDRPGTRPHLRGKAKELAVYLACRPNGGDVSIICEILYPDSTVAKSLTSVQQAVTSLRRVLTYHTTLRGNPILLSGDRYRLNPDLVDVDLWQLHRHTRAAAAATDPHQRQTHLEHATSLGATTLAPELDADWIEAYRVTTTVTIVEAHTALADLTTPHDPERATELLATAICADPGNEALYRRHMRLLASLGMTDAVHATIRNLTQVLADLDTAPEQATLDLARELLDAKPNLAALAPTGAA